MAAKPKKCIGTVACLVCGNEIPARENDNGTLDMGCGYCDFVGYAKAGTEAYQVISASVNRKVIDPAPDPIVKSSVPVPPVLVVPDPASAAAEKTKGKISWMP